MNWNKNFEETQVAKEQLKVSYLVDELSTLKVEVEKNIEERRHNLKKMECMVENFPGVSVTVIDPLRLTSELRIKAAVERVILLTPSHRDEHYTVHSDTGAEANFRPAGWSLQTIAKRIADDVLGAVSINKKRVRNTTVSSPPPINK